MEFIFSTQFKKQFAKLPKRFSERVKERLALFEGDEFHPLLNNHKLHGEYSRYRSINVGGDTRIVYRKTGPRSYFLIAIGSHTKLYD